MPPASPAPRDRLERRGPQVVLRPPRRTDESVFLAAVSASRRMHANWVRPPATSEAYRAFLKRFVSDARRDLEHTRTLGLVLCERSSGALAGVFNFSEIVRGALQSAYLGYFAFAGMEGRGYMREGLWLALDQAFGTLRLHRVEANIQPGNARSIALVESVGMRREGLSLRYVKVAGRWRDHARYAMLADEWRSRRRRNA